MSRALMFLAIVAGGWGVGAVLRAADQQSAAPLHDLVRLRESSPQGARVVPPRRDVLALKVYDGDPTLGRNAERGLLLRELVRQALLLAAREELGLPTRDQTLREPFPEADTDAAATTDLPLGSVQVVSSIPGRLPDVTSLRVSVFVEQPPAARMLWETELAIEKPSWHLIESLSEQLEELSRTKLPGVLKDGGFEGEPNQWVENGPVPEAVLRSSSEWNMVPQFFALRTLHRLIRQEGESPQRLAALAEAYARLGTLTAWHWGPAHQAFKARALLYAQRLMVRTDGSPLATQTRAYVLALLGRHDTALSIDLAKLKSEKIELSGTMQVVEAFCRFEEERLEELAADAALRPLVRYLQFLAVEPVRNDALLAPAAQALLEEDPDCFPAIDALARRGALGVRLGASQTAVEAVSSSLVRRLGKESDLPPTVRELLQHSGGRSPTSFGADAGQMQTQRALTLAFRQAGAVEKDRWEPSWACFAQLVQEEGFACAVREVLNQRNALGVPVVHMGQTIRELAPLFEGHPYEEIVRSYGRTAAENRQHIPDLFPSLDPSEFEVTSEAMGRELARHHRPAWNEFFVAAVDHLDLVYCDLVFQIQQGETWGGDSAAWKLARTSPHSPMRAVGQMRYQWQIPSVPKWAEQWEQRFHSHPEVLRELGRRYRESKNWEAAERVTARLAEVQASWRSYRELAAMYKEQEQWDKWLEALEAYLQTPETGLSHASVRVEIANHYMNQGDYRAALPYAETAAQTWAAWAMMAAVRCYDGLGDLENAHQWVSRLSQRYDSQALHWYFWCRHKGSGDVQAAQDHARKLIALLGTPLPESDLQRVAVYRLLVGQKDEALSAFRELYDRGRNPYDGLHAALTAHELGQRDLRDRLLQQIIQHGATQEVKPDKAPTVRLVELFWAARNEQDPPQLDHRAVGDLIRRAPPGEPTNLNYFVGKFLWLHEQTETAEPYLRRAARSPLSKFNRHLAGALLKDHEIDFGKVVHQELLPENE